MDPYLTQPIPVQLPKWQPYSGAPSLPGYTAVTSLTPILGRFLGTLPSTEGQLASEYLFGKLVGKVEDFEHGGPCEIMLAVKKKRKESYCKITHLLDPIRTIQGYYEHPEKGHRRRQSKLENPMNQAYVDALANYLLGQLRERNLSPHFCLFFGGYQAIANTYRFDITEDFASYRRYRAFWERRRAGLFSLHMEMDPEDEDSEPEEEDLDWILHTPSSSLRSTHFSYNTPKSAGSSTGSRRTHVSLDGEKQIELERISDELQSIGSFPSAEGGDFQLQGRSRSDSSTESEESDDEPGVAVAAEFKKYPVMLIFQEQMAGVLDDMLEDEEETGVKSGTPEWEARWTAWTFQIIAALSAAQAILGFTHNDLHTNNIAWSKTDEPWLWYRARDGTVFRVPTYGKIMRIIDFGRAIFRVGETWFASDDYERGGDAENQYNFEPGFVFAPAAPRVTPNPSFDLCRYAVSVIDALFPTPPAEVLEGCVLSQEGAWVVRESESPLWNLLWSWLLDKSGRNVLREEDGEERFPDFDLYQHISAAVFGAKPQDQIHKPIFSSYVIAAKDVGEWETIYPLFA